MRASLFLVFPIIPFSSSNRERAIEHSETDGFYPGNVWAVLFTFGREEKGARRIDDSRFLPLARKHVHKFISQRMSVGRDRDAGMKLTEHRHAAGGFVLVQHHQFDAGIRASLP